MNGNSQQQHQQSQLQDRNIPQREQREQHQQAQLSDVTNQSTDSDEQQGTQSGEYQSTDYDEHQDTDSNGPVVLFDIPEGETDFYVTNATSHIDKILYDKLAWKDPEARFKTQHHRSTWDGYHRLYRKGDHAAPVGLIDRATRALGEEGYSVAVRESDVSGDRFNFGWNFEHSLRDYQVEAVSNTIEQGGGIISIPTGGGKTVVAMNLIQYVGQRAIVFVHTQELLYQWADRISDVLGVEPGVIGDDNWSEGPVTVATMQTLNNRGADLLEKDYGMAIFDECHVTSAAETMQSVGLSIEAEWRVGLSATPWRQTPGEEMEIEAVTGDTAAEIGAEQLIDEGHLARPEFEFVSLDGQRVGGYNDEYPDVVRSCIELEPTRNHAAARKAAELAEDDYRVFVSVNRIRQGRLIEYALSDDISDSEILNEVKRGEEEAHRQKEVLNAVSELDCVGDYNVEFLYSKDSTERRQEVLDAFQDGDIDILISTLLKEGVDIPEITAIVQAEGGKSKIEKLQRIGRALRPDTTRDHAKVVDFEDEGKYLADHYEIRMNNLKEYYGAYGPGDGYSENIEAVRNYLRDQGVEVEACKLTETDDGGVTIQLVDYLGGEKFQTFLSATRHAKGISYDGEKNHCDQNWIQSISA